MSQSSPTVHLNLLTFTIVGAVLVVAFVVGFGLLNRRHTLASLVRSVVFRFAPGFLIIAPPLITYGFVCGALSFGFGLLCFWFDEPIFTSNPVAFFHPIFKGFEYFCGVGCGYLWLRFTAWLGLRWPWYLFILASHGLVAGYREARFDVGGREIGMGPTVTEHFIFLDALIPFLALLPYYLFHARKNAA